MLPIKDKYQRQFELFFPVFPVPENILVNDVSDGEFSWAINERFRFKLWTEIALHDWINIASIETIASYMSPSTFHYYLPSILKEAIGEVNYIDWALKSLVPVNKKIETKNSWWIEYFSFFNDQ